MNKTAIKNFAVWARNKLIADISYKAGLMGIAEGGIKSALPQSTKDTEFFDIGTREPYSISGEAVKQRKRLAELITQKAASSDYKTAYRSVIEEVAYTWFNRLIAIRFMEVNDYLPSHIRVLSSEGSTKLEPDLVTTPFDAELDLTAAETEMIAKLKKDNNVDECFRLLFVKQCNALNAILPNLFEKTSDYTELLLNVSVTDQDGVVYHLVHDIEEDDFNIEKGGQIEIIGWLYQYYNTEPKDEAFALLKNSVRISKERIPAATQLFTPDWIVRYMVENSLGRLWLEGHPNAELQSEWKYYLEEAEQEADVQVQLEKVRDEYKIIKPEEIKVIDPCMGSGHILVYAFDVLIQIYESAGYSKRDAAKSILENNIYGLDIDDRAFQLAYFAVMMKARQYNRRILNGNNTCHIYSIQESNTVNRDQLKYFGADLNELECNDAMNQITDVLDTFVDAKEYGSILNVDSCNWDLLRRFLAKTDDAGQMSIETIGIENTKEMLFRLIDIGQVMDQKYEIVATNPPYMGVSSMSSKLTEYVRNYYPNSKMDLFAIFIERCSTMIRENYLWTMITQHSWMFLVSFEDLRTSLLHNSIVNMAHLGARAFEEIGGEVVQTTSFVMRKAYIPDYQGCFARLLEENSQKAKELAFLKRENLYYSSTNAFDSIAGKTIAYWLSPTALSNFKEKKIGEVLFPKTGVTTGDNTIYLRFWTEIDFSKLGTKWFPLNKGGEFRKWYGNNEYVIDWENDGFRIRNAKGSSIRNPEFYFREGVTWSKIASGRLSARYSSSENMFDAVGLTCFTNSYVPNSYLLAYLCSCVANFYAEIINPTLSYTTGTIASLPFIFDSESSEKICSLSNQNVDITRNDWDSYELSRDFSKHPFLKYAGNHKVEECWRQWKIQCQECYDMLKRNEESLNEIFIGMFRLQDDLNATVEERNVSVRLADLGREIRSFISYSVGCMFGRYSTNVDGLIFAGGAWDGRKYSTFVPDADNIIPITDEEYFEDDIVGLFCGWLKKVYGVETLEENLDFIAKALGNKGNTSREIIRNYFLTDFMKDHMKAYQKRPIYWLFDSGKQNGFKALIYMHRYDENTIGNLRIDYLHRMERVYESEINRMQDVIDNSTTAREVTAATKRKEKLQKQVKECKEYDEKIAHLALARIGIDLDDGVKVNYEKVQTVDGKKYQVLAKI